MATNTNLPKPNETKDQFIKRIVANLMKSGKSQVQATKTATNLWDQYVKLSSRPIRKGISNVRADSSAMGLTSQTYSPSSTYVSTSSAANLPASMRYSSPSAGSSPAVRSSSLPNFQNTPTANTSYNRPAPSPIRHMSTSSASATPQNSSSAAKGPAPQQRGYEPIVGQSAEIPYHDSNAESRRYAKVRGRANAISNNPFYKYGSLGYLPHQIFGDAMPQGYQNLVNHGFKKNTFLDKIEASYPGAKVATRAKRVATQTPTEDAIRAQKEMGNDYIGPKFMKNYRDSNLTKRAAAKNTEYSDHATETEQVMSTGYKGARKVGQAADLVGENAHHFFKAIPAISSTIAAGRRANELTHFTKNAKDYGGWGVAHRANETAKMTRGLGASVATAAVPYVGKSLGITGLGSALGKIALVTGGNPAAIASAAMIAGIAPALLGILTKTMAMRHKSKIRGTRLSGFDRANKLAGLGGIDSAMQTSAGSFTAYESLSLSVNRAHIAIAADTNAILHHYMENAQTKDTTEATDQYKENMGEKRHKNIFQMATSVAGAGLSKISEGVHRASQKFNPLHQIGTFLLQGMTPNQEKEEIDKLYGEKRDNKARKKLFKEEEKTTGIPAAIHQLMNTPGIKISDMAESTQGKTVTLLTAIFDVMRYNTMITKNIAVRGYHIRPGDIIPSPVVKKGSILGTIPGLTGILNLITSPIHMLARTIKTAFGIGKLAAKTAFGVGKVAFGAAKGIYKVGKFIKDIPEKMMGAGEKITSKIYNGARNLIAGPLDKYKKDPNALVEKALGSKGINSGDLKEQVLNKILPNKLGEITGHQKEQINELRNIYDVGRQLLHTLSGKDHQHKDTLDTSRDVLDSFTGEMVSSKEMKARVKDRQTKMQKVVDKEMRIKWFDKLGGKDSKVRKLGKKLGTKLTRFRSGLLFKHDQQTEADVGVREGQDRDEVVNSAMHGMQDPIAAARHKKELEEAQDHKKKQIIRERMRDRDAGGDGDRRKALNKTLGYLGNPKYEHQDLDPPDINKATQSPLLGGGSPGMRVTLVGMEKSFVDNSNDLDHTIRVRNSVFPKDECLMIEKCRKKAKEEKEKFVEKNTRNVGMEMAEVDAARKSAAEEDYRKKSLANNKNLPVPPNNSPTPKDDKGGGILDLLKGVFGFFMNGTLLGGLLKVGGALATLYAGFQLADSGIGMLMKGLSALSSGFKGVTEVVGGALSKIGEAAKGAWDFAKGGASKIGEAASWAWDAVKGGASKISEVAKSTPLVAIGKDVADVVTKYTDKAAKFVEPVGTAIKSGVKWAEEVTGIGELAIKIRDWLGEKVQKAAEGVMGFIDKCKNSKSLQKAMVWLKKVGDGVNAVFTWINKFKLGRMLLRGLFILPIIEDFWEIYKEFDEKQPSTGIILLRSLGLVGDLAAVPAIAAGLGAISFGALPFLLFLLGELAKHWADKIKKGESELSEEDKKKAEEYEKKFKLTGIDKEATEKAINENKGVADTEESKDGQKIPQPNGPPEISKPVEVPYSPEGGLTTLPEKSEDKKEDSYGDGPKGPYVKQGPDQAPQAPPQNFSTQATSSTQMMKTEEYLKEMDIKLDKIDYVNQRILTIKEWEQDRLILRDRKEQEAEMAKAQAEATKAQSGQDGQPGLLSQIGSGISGAVDSVKSALGFGKSGGSGGAGFSPEIHKVIEDAAAKHGIDPALMKTMAQIESQGKADISSPTGARGLFQFTKGTGTQYGLMSNGQDMRGDPALNADAAARLMKDNIAGLQKRGLEVNATNVYLAHQLGLGGASELLNAAKNGSDISSNLKASMGVNFGNVSPQEYLERTNKKLAEASSASSRTASSGQAYQSASGLGSAPLQGDQFAFPVANATMTSPMGARNVQGGSSDHKGNDYRGAVGDSVFAAADGIIAVSKAGEIVIKHEDGTSSRYMHMPQNKDLKINDTVKKGQPIGTVGTVNTQAPHLHFEMRDAQQNVIDPDQFFRKNLPGYNPQKVYSNASERDAKVQTRFGGGNIQQSQQQASQTGNPQIQNAASSMPNGSKQVPDSQAGGPEEIMPIDSKPGNASSGIVGVVDKMITSLDAINKGLANMVMKQQNAPQIGAAGGMGSSIGEITSTQSVTSNRGGDQEIPPPIVTPIPVQTPPMLAAMGGAQSPGSNQHVQERAIDPVSQKIIEQVFANTIVSFQQSVQSYAIGQSPFSVHR